MMDEVKVEAQRYKLAQSVPYGGGAFVIPAGQVVVREADYQSVRDECGRLMKKVKELEEALNAKQCDSGS